MLRTELAHKNLELIESETRNKQALEERDELKKRYELLKKDMIALKKQLDREQKEVLAR